ncbi:MAG TPA: phosphate acyltransferase, partial [Tichowtungia sp.]|nr:phosphate acyltransferase [Tichowtungia sp.]
MSRSEFITGIIEKAKADKRTIVLPEGSDERVADAAKMLVDEGIANVIVLGDETVAGRAGDGVTVVNPAASEKLDAYVQAFYELRKARGM